MKGERHVVPAQPRFRNAILIAAALACGAVSLVAGRHWMNQQIEAERARLQPEAVATRVVLVARDDLESNEVLGEATVATRTVPESFVPGDAFDPEQFDQIEGLRLARAYRAGEIITRAQVLGADQRSFSHLLSEGRRALTLPVDEVNSISGMLQPGDHIDLFFTARPPPGATALEPIESTAVLFPNLRVLATGRQSRVGAGEGSDAERTSHGTLTVEVSAPQAQQLIVAQAAGRLTAVLRNPDDQGKTEQAAMDVRHLLGIDTAPVPRPAPRMARPRGPALQMIVGGMGGDTRQTALPLPPAPATPAPRVAAGPTLPDRSSGSDRTQATPPAAAVEPSTNGSR